MWSLTYCSPQNLATAHRVREQEKTAAAQQAAKLESKVEALEAQLQDKDRLLRNMQQLLQESARSHNSIAEDLDKRQLLDQSTVMDSKQALRDLDIAPFVHNHLHAHRKDGGASVDGVRTGIALGIVTCQALFIPSLRRRSSPPAIEASDSPIKGIVFARDPSLGGPSCSGEGTSKPSLERTGSESPPDESNLPPVMAEVLLWESRSPRRSPRRPLHPFLQDPSFARIHKSAHTTLATHSSLASPLLQDTNLNNSAAAALTGSAVSADLGFVDKWRVGWSEQAFAPVPFATVPSAVDDWKTFELSSGSSYTPIAPQSQQSLLLSAGNTAANTPRAPRVLSLSPRRPQRDMSQSERSIVSDNSRQKDATLVAPLRPVDISFSCEVLAGAQTGAVTEVVEARRHAIVPYSCRPERGPRHLKEGASEGFHVITHLQASVRRSVIGRK